MIGECLDRLVDGPRRWSGEREGVQVAKMQVNLCGMGSAKVAAGGWIQYLDDGWNRSRMDSRPRLAFLVDIAPELPDHASNQWRPSTQRTLLLIACKFWTLWSHVIGCCSAAKHV